MYDFQLEMPTTAAVLFGCAVFFLVLVWVFYIRPVRRVTHAIEASENDEVPEVSVSASVIVFACDEADALKHLLPIILGQRYDSPFEVIVVNEGQSDATVAVVERLRNIHNNLYLTHTPDGARQLSRKKLALMIGIKAARYPVVVHTTASARIDSEDWLARMTAPFATEGVEVVIGHSFIDPSQDKGLGRRGRTFNSAADDVVWLASALKGRPYRGTELNLAYTRDAFFRNRGFSRSLNLKYGDDDLFVNEIANKDNTAVVLHPDSVVKRTAWNVPRVYKELRSRYRFTGRQLSHIPRFMQTLGTWLLWLILCLSVAGALLMLPNLLGVVIGAVIILAALIWPTVVWRKAIKVMYGKSMMLTLPWLAFMRPFANIVSSLKAKKNNKYNYTWN